MKKILFIVKRFPPKMGGVERHVYSVSKELIKAGHSIDIITSYNEYLKATDEANLNIHYIRDPKIKYVGILFIWMQLVLKLKLFISSDVIHVHDIMIWIMPVKVTLFWKKFYLTMHGWEGHYPIPLKNIVLKRISAKIATASISVGKYIDKYYGTKSDLIIYGAANNNDYRSIKKIKEIVYLGRLDRDTGLPILLKSIDKNNLYKYLFVGDGELRSECLRYGEVTGMVHNPGDYTRNAEIVAASGYLSIIESLQQKCLVVCFFENELKKDYYALSPFSKYIVTIENKKHLQKLLSNYKRSKYKKMISDGHNYALTLTWEKIIKQYLQLWSEY